MRRTLIAAGLLLLVALVVVALDAGDILFVQVRDAELRSSPGFLSTIVSRLEFGDEVSYQETRSGFIQVSIDDGQTSGWIHEGAIAENKTTDLQLQGESTTRQVTSREIALAGRGFSETLEDEYGTDNDLDFAAVDDLEAFRIDPQEMVGFVEDAQLRLDFLTGETE